LGKGAIKNPAAVSLPRARGVLRKCSQGSAEAEQTVGEGFAA